MDQGTLVEMQIRDGQRLIDKLQAEGVPVTAAGWLKESDSGQWFLYLATPLVRPEGSKRHAYRQVNTVVGKLEAEGLWVDPFEIKVIGPDSPLGEDLQRNSSTMPTKYGGARLGDLNIEGAYLYPATTAIVG